MIEILDKDNESVWYLFIENMFFFVVENYFMGKKSI